MWISAKKASLSIDLVDLFDFRKNVDKWWITCG